MSDPYRKAAIFVRDTYAGELSETDDGYSFAYAPAYLDSSDPLPVSLSLPLTEEIYLSKVLFPFFDGLIPEGWLLGVVSRNWKIDQKDRFVLLMVACHDCIGSVSIREVGA